MNHTYAFVGLPPSERSLLESIFALDADDAPGDALVPVGLDDNGAHGPDLLVVNGDDLAVAERLSADYPNALLVLVGRPRGAQAVRWPVMRRPLDLQGAVAVLSELDWPTPVLARDEGHAGSPSQLMQASTAFPSEPPSSAFAPTTASAPLSVGHATRAGEPLSARLTWKMSEIAVADAPAEALPVQPVEILVVHGRPQGPSPSLARGLHRMGYEVMTLSSPDEAMAVMARQRVPFVFLDQHSLGSQLLPLARALSALRAAPTQPPHLAVIARGGSAFDRLRARMAGCAWMRVPIDKQRLSDYLARRGLAQPGDDETTL